MAAIMQVNGEPAAHVDVPVPRTGEQPRSLAAIDLVALPTAVAVARMFVADTLRRWEAMVIEPDMEAVAAELVTLSVKATGPAEETSWQDIQRIGAIKVCLMGWSRHIVVKVADQHDQELVLSDDVALPGDSGIGLVDARAGRWGSRLTQTGRVMWAELAVYERTPVGLPRRRRTPSPSPRNRISGQQHDEAYSDLLHRVRDGLKRS
ncbi:ATP-binding protein [Amycolatopsis vastitatis]|nr:ATP-binding protein [Amycolatopsis vastitatis]